MRRDRLEVLTALVNGPEFDPVLRGGVLKIPPTHPVYPWSCTVVDCERPRWRRYAMCSVHAGQWQEAEARGMSRAQFLRSAEPLSATEIPEAMMCRICPERPAFSLQRVLCFRHRNRWLSYRKRLPGRGERGCQSAASVGGEVEAFVVRNVRARLAAHEAAGFQGTQGADGDPALPALDIRFVEEPVDRCAPCRDGFQGCLLGR
ncbi:hypothetical protein [Streptomyces sp. H39-C1]|uniref:hypothetical protein n=1 Tax=Streptomyces sp. H39-C1 TaxID=3004355 RepID=UPI0022AEC4F5|nr:hypothetical protein [Streptomyces sp. H39-C1]MCZ4101791.1 hypothetical protein [Streptomyces sp. H39-C1]